MAQPADLLPRLRVPDDQLTPLVCRNEPPVWIEGDRRDQLSVAGEAAPEFPGRHLPQEDTPGVTFPAGRGHEAASRALGQRRKDLRRGSRVGFAERFLFAGRDVPAE